MNPSIRTDLPPVPNPAVISRKGLGDDLILVNCDTGESLSLNITGMIVWELIQEGKNSDEIISNICQRFKNVPDSVHEEVTGLISLLVEGGFIGYELAEK